MKKMSKKILKMSKKRIKIYIIAKYINKNAKKLIKTLDLTFKIDII